MAHLKLISSNPDVIKNSLYTDSLIDNAFGFIGEISGSENTSNMVYTTALDLFEAFIYEGYPPIAYVYQPDLDLWAKRVCNLSLTTKIPFTPSNEFRLKLSGLSNLLMDLSREDEDIARLNLNEVLNYSSYLLFDTFLAYLDNPQNSPIFYPNTLKVLNRNDVSKEIKELLSQKNDIIFAGNGDIGFRN